MTSKNVKARRKEGWVSLDVFLSTNYDPLKKIVLHIYILFSTYSITNQNG